MKIPPPRPAGEGLTRAGGGDPLKRAEGRYRGVRFDGGLVQAGLYSPGSDTGQKPRLPHHFKDKNPLMHRDKKSSSPWSDKLVRRCFFHGILVASFILPPLVFSGEKRQSNSAAVPYRGPIIDAHSHPKRKKANLRTFFKEAKAANVKTVIVMKTPNDYNKGRQKLLRNARRFSRALTLCSADFAGYIHSGDMDRARRVLERTRENLENGDCAGIGEVGLRHYDKSAKQDGDHGGQSELLIDLNHAMVLEMLGLADKHGAPVVLHIEPVYSVSGIDNLSEVKNWYKKTCRRFPRAKLIAAHNAMMSPKDFEELLLSCGNLFSDFKFMLSRGAFARFEDLHPINDHNFKFFPRWGQMFEKYPERFIFGSDWKFGRRAMFDDYSGHIRAVRKMLGVLRPAVQRKILYENARRVFSID